MEFGVHLPDAGGLAGREPVLAFARTAEALGYESLWSSDHIAWPDVDQITSQYPYGENSGFPSPGSAWLDCIGTLTFAAAATETIKLGTTVLIIGYRPAIQQAKAWATLDVLSGGRALLVVGVGWMKEEFEAIGMPWDQRGQRADEFLEIFEKLWAEERVSHDGEFDSFGPIGFSPKPLNGRIPVWVGGHTKPAFRRAAKYGDAFHAAFTEPDELAAMFDGVAAACEAVDRDPAEVDKTMLHRVLFDKQVSGSISGSTDQIVDQLGVYAELGVSHMAIFFLQRGGLEGRLEAIRRFAEEVRPQLS